MSQIKTTADTTRSSDRSWLGALGEFLERGVDRLFHRTQHPNPGDPVTPPVRQSAKIGEKENQTGLTA